jgi:formate dehydrogenase subunit gamma
VTTAVTSAGWTERFDRAERIVHWTSAALFLTLMATGAVLYIGDLAALVGRRNFVKHVHVYAGLALPVPLVAGLVRRAGSQLRADVTRLARWSPDDRRWLHRRTRARAQLGKFNPGQKLNATFLAAAMVVMLATGSIMYWFEFFSNDVRTGATFVHDWFAFGVWAAIIGHVGFALADRTALHAMLHGPVPDSWALAKRPRWYDEQHPDVVVDDDGIDDRVDDETLPAPEGATVSLGADDGPRDRPSA